LTAWGYDNELIGETIASIVSEHITDSNQEGNFVISPDVRFVFNDEKRHLNITSKHLKDVIATSLDEYAIKKGGAEKGKAKHIKISFNPEGPKTGKDSWNISTNQSMKEDIANAIALSVLNGDHDVNPGNMVVIKDEKGNPRVSRIDYGHALHDLITHAFDSIPEAFGAKAYSINNRVLDFFNRDTVVHLNESGQIPKLWRDFDGVCPSKELVKALRLYGDKGKSKKIKNGLADAKSHLMEFLKEIKKDPQNKGLVEHIKQSAIQLNSGFSQKAIASNLTMKESVDALFTNLDDFYNKGQTQMLQVAELMELQCDIKEMVEQEGVVGLKSLEKQKANIKTKYRSFISKKDPDIVDGDKINWIKTSKDSKPYSGNLEGYIEFALVQKSANLWKNIDTLHPSRELVKALRSVTSIDNKGKMDNVLKHSEEHLLEFMDKMAKYPENENLITQIKKSRTALLSEIGKESSAGKTDIKNFVSNLADLMELQCDIKEMVKTESTISRESGDKEIALKESLAEQKQRISKKYAELKICDGISIDGGKEGINWIRNSKDIAPFNGDLNGFINFTKSQQNANLSFVPEKNLIVNPELVVNPDSKIANKDGGANSVGKFGGIYKINGKTNLVKREKDESKNIAEFLGSKIFSIRENVGAKVSLATMHNDDEVYLASEFFDDYTDFFKDVYRKAGKEIPDHIPEIVKYVYRKIGKAVPEDSRPRIVGKETTDLFKKAFKQKGIEEYKGFPEIMATSLLIGDFDVHWGNIGVINKANTNPKLVRIDFAAAFSNLGKEINPHSMSEHNMVTIKNGGMQTQPTNHFKEFPRHLKLRPDFIEELQLVASQDLDDKIQESMKDLQKYYKIDQILKFGKDAGLQDVKEVDGVSIGLKTLLKERQKSLNNFATELQIELCLSKENKDWKLGSYKNTKGAEVKFEDVVKNNPEYFKSVLEGKRNIKFYDLDHKDSFSIFSSNPDAASLKRLFITIFDPVVRILTAGYYSLDKKFDIEAAVKRNADELLKDIEKAKNQSIPEVEIDPLNIPIWDNPISLVSDKKDKKDLVIALEKDLKNMAGFISADLLKAMVTHKDDKRNFLDTASKMSHSFLTQDPDSEQNKKSGGAVISLVATEKSITKKIEQAVTDNILTTEDRDLVLEEIKKTRSMLESKTSTEEGINELISSKFKMDTLMSSIRIMKKTGDEIKGFYPDEKTTITRILSKEIEIPKELLQEAIVNHNLANTMQEIIADKINKKFGNLEGSIYCFDNSKFTENTVLELTDEINKNLKAIDLVHQKVKSMKEGSNLDISDETAKAIIQTLTPSIARLESSYVDSREVYISQDIQALLESNKTWGSKIVGGYSITQDSLDNIATEITKKYDQPSFEESMQVLNRTTRENKLKDSEILKRLNLFAYQNHQDKTFKVLPTSKEIAKMRCGNSSLFDKIFKSSEDEINTGLAIKNEILSRKISPEEKLYPSEKDGSEKAKLAAILEDAGAKITLSKLIQTAKKLEHKSSESPLSEKAQTKALKTKKSGVEEAVSIRTNKEEPHFVDSYSDSAKLDVLESYKRLKTLFKEEGADHHGQVYLYKKIQENFSSLFKNINWINQNTDTREMKINNSFSLSESKYQTNINGKIVDARVINLNPKISGGPLHLSFVLRDQSGKNMKKSEALYFTAHYNKSGVLEEMTYPNGVEFNNAGQAFIEKNGMIYTLPVNETILNNMNHALKTQDRNPEFSKKPRNRTIRKRGMGVRGT